MFMASNTGLISDLAETCHLMALSTNNARWHSLAARWKRVSEEPKREADLSGSRAATVQAALAPRKRAWQTRRRVG
jgi:hypothetical protein